MCSSHVAQAVRERIKTEGLPSVSRRNFLKMGSVLGAGAALAPQLARADSHSASGKVFDLSHTLSPDNPVFPGLVDPATRETRFTLEESIVYFQRWAFDEHTGTHMDFPSHFIADAPHVDAVPATKLVGPAVVIDIAARAEEDPDAIVTVEDLQAWESEHGEIPEGAFVFMYSGWEHLIGSPAFLGDDSGLHFPGFGGEAAQWLVSERSIHGVGVDTLSIDHGISQTLDVHYTILGSGLLGIENVANLQAIRDIPSTIVCGIPKYEAGSGGPARILALA